MTASHPIVTRFAPSPTGRLHLGSALAALVSWRAAREAGGTHLLRIEDIDGTRCRPEHEAGMLDDLAWLGIDWDGPVRRQSEHIADYRAALDRLDAMGLLYPCFCTRADIRRAIDAKGGVPEGPDGPVYPGTCRTLSASDRAARIAAGEPHALRLDMARAIAAVGGPLTWTDREAGEQQATPEMFGDVVLARKETPTSYHLAVTVDDALQGVTLVTRGMDLFDATHVHRLLQALLGLPVPDWGHHRLILDDKGEKYAKRAGSPAIVDMRNDGVTPAEILKTLGFSA